MKKVLIITYYWPPAGGPGVQRVLKFAKYLPQFGWEPIILTVENGNFPAIDKNLLNEIPANLKVYKTKTLEPFAIYNRLRGKEKYTTVDTFTITKSQKSIKEKFGKFVRTYCFIPDARKGWKHYAVKEGIKIIDNENIDLIFSSSPPHSLQLIAKKIASKTKLPWVADFRDPWSNAFWLDESQKKGWTYNKNLKLEKSVFNNMHHFTTVSNGVLESFKLLYPSIKDRASLIHNGFDKADFSDMTKRQNSSFVIRYVGTLALSQNPTSLFEGLALLKKENQDIYKNIKLEFWGRFDNSIKENVKNYQLNDIVTFYDYVSHKKAVDLMDNSDVLLLVIPFGASKGILTGKLYEYIATRNPILGLGPIDCEAQSIIESNQLGIFGHKPDTIYRQLLVWYNEWSNGNIKKHDNDIEMFSRKELTKKLSEIFDKTLKQCN